MNGETTAVPTAPPYACDRKVRALSRDISSSRESLNDVPFFGSTPTGTANEFQVLRRWSSYTPMLNGNHGGGFFLRWQRKGIVIDPGVTFVDVFRNTHEAERIAAHSMADVNLVIVTHDHPDHCEDLSLLLVLARSYNRALQKRDALPKGKITRPIHLIQSHGAYFRSHILLEHDENRTMVNSCKILPRRLVREREMALRDEYSLELDCLRTRHHELLGDHSALGLRLNLYRPDGSHITICDSGDTKYDDIIAEQYLGAKVVLLHVGTMEDLEDREQQRGRGDHMCFYGVVRTLEKLKEQPPSLVLLTEWGEEFRNAGYRERFTDLARRAAHYSFPLLPADLGLRLDLDTCCIWCRNRTDPNGPLVLVKPGDVKFRDVGGRVEYWTP